MLGRKPWVRWPPASSDMPSIRWLPNSWRSFSQSASESSLTFLAPNFSSAGRLDAVREDRPERDEVGVDAGVRLGVGVRRAEQLAGVLGRERLHRVDVLAAGVEAVADRALGVLVGEPGAHRQQHGRRGVVLRRDQLERAALVGELGACGLRHTGLDRGDDLEGGVVGGADRRSAVVPACNRAGEVFDAVMRPSLVRGPDQTARQARAYQIPDTRLTTRDWGLWDRRPDRETAPHDRCNDDVPRGSPPRGPRSYPQHDVYVPALRLTAPLTSRARERWHTPRQRCRVDPLRFVRLPLSLPRKREHMTTVKQSPTPAGPGRTPRPRPKRGEGQWALGYREPLNPNEQSKKDDNPLNVRARIENIYAHRGFASIDGGDLRGRFRWWGLYTQRKPGLDGGKTGALAPEELDDEFFMLRVRSDGALLERRAAARARRRSPPTSAATPPTSPTGRTSSTTGSGSRTSRRSGSASRPSACRPRRPAATRPAASSAPRSPASPPTRSSTAPRRSRRSSGATSATPSSPTCRASSRPRSPATRARTWRPRSTTCPSSAPCTPSTAPASTSGSAAASPPTRCSPRSSASGSRSTRCPTSGRA